MLSAACGTTPVQSNSLSATLKGVDAHDGHVLQVGDKFYLYGTSYNCGFTLGRPGTRWCGFNVYTSKDLHHWTSRGPMFNPDDWQSECSPPGSACFRADVIHNTATGQYVLWFNVASSTAGYEVMTSATPLGPWKKAPRPTLAVRGAGSGGLVYGDESVFTEGRDAWIAYTVIGEGNRHDVAVQQLNSTWTSGSGRATTLGASLTEAPSMFARHHRYYLTYSDPACSYCSGTGTAVASAPTPLGPWRPMPAISTNSCGGQPAFVAELTVEGQPAWLYSADLWDHGKPNESQARIYLATLQFGPQGDVRSLPCANADPPPS